MDKELEIANELSEKLVIEILAYNGKITTAGVIGILEIIKHTLISDAQGN